MAKKPAEAVVYKDIDGKIVVEEFGSPGRADSRARELKAHGIKSVKTITKIDWIESESEYKKILEKTKSAVKAMRDKKTTLDKAIKALDDAIDLEIRKAFPDFEKVATEYELSKKDNQAKANARKRYIQIGYYIKQALLDSNKLSDRARKRVDNTIEKMIRENVR